MKYYKNNLKINSDIEINVLNEMEKDVDLIINLDNRVVNLRLYDLPNYIINRIQLTEVKSILIRHSLIEGNNTATIHFLRVIDLNSSLMNFSVDYSKIYIEILNEDFSLSFNIRKKGWLFEN